MTLPSSPPLSLTDILAELGRLSAGQSLSGAADERTLSGIASGPISFSDYLGKSSWSFVEVGASGGIYTPGPYDALVIGVAYGSTNGALVTMNGMTFAGQAASIQVKTERLNGSTPIGAAIGIYTGAATSGTVAFTSTGTNGSTKLVRVYKVIGYGGVHDTAAFSSHITTVSGKAAVIVDGNAAGTVTAYNPTTGANITTGAYQCGLSLA